MHIQIIEDEMYIQICRHNFSLEQLEQFKHCDHPRLSRDPSDPTLASSLLGANKFSSIANKFIKTS